MRRHSKPSNKQRNASTKTQNTLRIISGQWRGRRLPIADLEGLRPTPDHLRETLFNWLMFDIAGARCLDAFAGSGALGTEALSREAKEVIFIEKSSLASKAIRENMATLTGAQHTVINTDTLTWLESTPPTPFDIIFLDPPFRKDLVPPACHLLQTKGWLASGSYIYVETEKEVRFTAPEQWTLNKEKLSGQVLSRLYRVEL